MEYQEEIFIKIKKGPEIDDFLYIHPNGWTHEDWLHFRDKVFNNYGSLDEQKLGAFLEKMKLERDERKNKKNCNFCQELINENALVCPFCHRKELSYEEKNRVRKKLFWKNEAIINFFAAAFWITVIGFAIKQWLGISLLIIGIISSIVFYIYLKNKIWDEYTDEQLTKEFLKIEEDDRIEKEKRARRFRRTIIFLIIGAIILVIYYLSKK